MKKKFSREDFEVLLINLQPQLIKDYKTNSPANNTRYEILLNKIVFEYYPNISEEEFEATINKYDFDTEEGMKSFTEHLHKQVREFEQEFLKQYKEYANKHDNQVATLKLNAIFSCYEQQMNLRSVF